jgi:hypothetical protein
VLRARAGELEHAAPPGLRTRLQALVEQERASTGQARPIVPLGWSGQLSAFAAATVRSTALLAAQLALDHLKCFTIEGDAGAPPIKSQAETILKKDYDLDVAVPATLPDQHLELMAVRRCLYGDGRAAHVMYRLDGESVSLFVIPGVRRPAAELSLFGHDQVVWSEGDRTYLLIARGGTRAGLSRVASHLRTEAK